MFILAFVLNMLISCRSVSIWNCGWKVILSTPTLRPTVLLPGVITVWPNSIRRFWIFRPVKQNALDNTKRSLNKAPVQICSVDNWIETWWNQKMSILSCKREIKWTYNERKFSNIRVLAITDKWSDTHAPYRHCW